MGKRLFANNASGKLNAGISDVQTNFTLQAGQGALFPNTATGKTYSVTAIDSSGGVEIIKVTAHAGGSDSFTAVVRGQEGTTPLTLLAGDKIELRLTAGGLDELDVKPVLQTIAGDTVLDYDDFFTRLVITASANVTLPDSDDVAVGDYIEFKSLTTGHVRFTPDGADTIDGVNALWRVPSYTSGKIMKIAGGEWALVDKPDVEVGDSVFWPVASATPKRGYEFADNVAVSRATFAGLFAVYGETHGVGDGVTTFGKPDFRGRAPFGRDDMGGAAAGRITNAVSGIVGTTVGATGGAQSVQITVAELPASPLSVAPQAVNASGDINIYQPSGGEEFPVTKRVGVTLRDDPAVAGTQSVTVAGATVGGNTSNMGAGGALNKMPGALIGNWLVKT